ncbi:MAG: ABC transporter permease [Anaerolineae bacterium]|nr:ABC transporter permease [Anaerolineae bacterium]
MARYLTRRALQSLLVLLGVSFVIFVISRLGGDPVSLMVGPDVQEAEREALRRQLGLDAPLYVQYLRFLSGAVRGDFGTSILAGVPAMNLVLERLPATLQLAAFALAFAAVVGIPLGVASAIRRNTWLDYVGTGVTLLGQSLPSFWLGILLILVLGLQLRLLPISGRGTPLHLVMPGVTLGFSLVAVFARLTRSSMLEVLTADYVRTAKSKGLRPRTITIRHEVKNAMIPLVTVMGMSFATLMGGAVVTEQIFAWPGIGRLALNSIYQRDFPVIQADVLFVSAVVVAMNLLVDVVYTLLDPRIRYA